MAQQLKPLHLVCVDDEMRPNLKMIEIKNGIAQATNGHILVKLQLNTTSTLTPEQIAILNGKYIHMNVWKELWKCDLIELDDEWITCNKDGIVKRFEYAEPNGSFFTFDTIIGEIKEAGEEPQRIVCYNPDFITILAKIFQTESLFFSFSPNNKGTIVFPDDVSGMFAVLMPKSTDAQNRYLYLTD